uniref:Uncharacterized protein n=1 Tax=Oryza nivara TaxID=4536 RepID=A0A0E0HTV0_ORYNI
MPSSSSTKAQAGILPMLYESPTVITPEKRNPQVSLCLNNVFSENRSNFNQFTGKCIHRASKPKPPLVLPTTRVEHGYTGCMTDIPKSRVRQLVMQPLNCVIFLLGLAILSVTFGPFVTIAHRELMMATYSEKGPENKLDHGVDETRTYEEIKSKIFAGRKMAFGVAVMENHPKDARSKPSSGEISNYSSNSRVPSSLKDSSSSTMKARPSVDNIKLEGSTSEQTLNIPNPQHIIILPFKPYYRHLSLGSKKEQKGSSICCNSYRTNEDWKEKMLESRDEVLRLLNKDYHANPHRRPPVHN